VPERTEHLLKTLINLTPVIIVATAMPILWERLSSSRQGWVECKQLTTNRLAGGDLPALGESGCGEVPCRVDAGSERGRDWQSREGADGGRAAPGEHEVRQRRGEALQPVRARREDESLETFANAIASEEASVSINHGTHEDTDMKTITAYAWGSGLIQFTTPKRRRTVPEGALPIATGPAVELRNIINVLARHGYRKRATAGARRS